MSSKKQRALSQQKIVIEKLPQGQKHVAGGQYIHEHPATRVTHPQFINPNLARLKVSSYLPNDVRAISPILGRK
jgi:hypothetical protein